MAWLGICYFKQQLLSFSLLTSILQANYQYKSIFYDLETPSMYVLIKFMLLVYLSSIYSVNQSSYSFAGLKKKIFGLIADLKALYKFSPQITKFLKQDLNFQDLATIKLKDIPCSLKPRAASK